MSRCVVCCCCGVQDGTIVIATPEQWDVTSRRWTTRKNVQTVALFIVDELHLVGSGEVGPVIEVICSRMRYIASQTQNPLRILALSTSVANAKDLGDWLGAAGSNMYNFPPQARPVQLEIRIQGFDINSHSARQLAMSKPCYNSIKKHSADHPVIVFVPSRKEARTVAVDLVTAAASEDAHKRFVHMEESALEPHLKRLKNAALIESLRAGVGFMHEGLSEAERATVEVLFKNGAIQVAVVEQALCWGMSMSAHLVVIMGTDFYDGKFHKYNDYPIADVLQMMGRASRPRTDQVGKCSIFCHAPKKEFYKKFLFEPFPVESHVDHFLADHLNSEIVTKRVENVQDAMDYLTWTFYYRRITQNPNYYNLQGVTHRHLSDHLSELVESTLSDLASSNCIAVEDESEVSPLNLGMIAAFYYLKHTTVDTFNRSLTAKVKLKGLLDILTSAAEFDLLPVRSREDAQLKKLANHLPVPIAAALEDNSSLAAFNDPKVKAHVLLQTHFSRVALTAALSADQKKVLPDAVRLLQAMVDVLSSKGWLAPAITCMEMSQMLVQGMWNSDPALLQLPHITGEHVAAFAKHSVNTVYDFLEMDDALRTKLLSLPQRQVVVRCERHDISHGFFTFVLVHNFFFCSLFFPRALSCVE